MRPRRCPPTQEAADIYRELAAALPDRYRPGLASVLASLGGRLAELGHLAEAVPPVEEAVAIYRELAAELPDRYRSGLASALARLAAVMSRLGREAQASDARSEAEVIRKSPG